MIVATDPIVCTFCPVVLHILDAPFLFVFQFFNVTFLLQIGNVPDVPGHFIFICSVLLIQVTEWATLRVHTTEEKGPAAHEEEEEDEEEAPGERLSLQTGFWGLE